VTPKRGTENGLNPISKLILDSASQKVRVRLSIERAYEDQTDKGPSDTYAGEAATSAGRAEGGAGAIIRCRRDHVQANAARLCPRVDRRPEPCLAARRADRSRVHEDFHRADVGRGYRPAAAILTAWEGGRLREIIEQVARIENMDASVLVSLLSEHQVLTALHVAEAVKLKLEVVDGLRRRIAGRELENDIRDYIAKNPWLISPHWGTFQVERRISRLVEDAAREAGITDDIDWNGRVDLALSSGNQLVVLEFMRPDLTVDRAHIDRFQRYVDILRARVTANTALGFRDITGLLVATGRHKSIPADGSRWDALRGVARAAASG
jgi:hypothetical protein